MSSAQAWVNFFNLSLDARGTDDHIPAETLRKRIEEHDGREAYHSAFDLLESELKLEEDTGKVDGKGKRIYRYHTQSPEALKRWPKTVTSYNGVHRPAMGYVWLDFDSKDGGQTALQHARECLQWLGQNSGTLAFYSGSKGFHLGVPLACFGLEPNPHLGKQLNFIAAQLKKTRWDSIDTTVFNPQRKFRALGSKHPKTGLYKISCSLADALESIKEQAKARGTLTIPEPINAPLVAELAALCAPYSPASQDAISHDEFRKYRQAEGTRALEECAFLAHCAKNAATINEPEWYAAASIVARFKDGRAKFHAMSKGHPHYSVSETDDKIEQALQASGPRTCKGINALWGKCGECKHFEKIKSPVVILEKDVIPTEATGFYFIDMNDNGTVKRTPDYGGLLNAYIRDFSYFRDSRAEKTYVWNGTHYAVATATDIMGWCEEVMQPKPSQKMRNEFRSKVEVNCLKPASQIEHFFYTTTQGKLNLKNGVLDVATGELLPHDDRTGFTYCLPYEFDPKADCPTFKKFLSDVTLQRADLQKTLIEFMAYTLWPSYDDHCFLWLSGGGRNGKSTFMEVVQALVGEENASSVLLDFFERPNYLEMMNHKLVNVSEESDSRKISPQIMGILKALSSGARVQVDQKYQMPYSMRATAKLIFASNTPPVIAGTEDAMKSRMIVVPFDLRLEEHGETATTSRIDWSLPTKLRAELPGILNLVLSALRDFAARQPRKIYRSAATQAAMNEIMRDSDPVERWLQDNVLFLPDPNAGSGISIEMLYGDFKQYNVGSDFLPEMHWFARRLRAKVGTKAVAKRLRIADNQTTAYFGISLQKPTEF